MKLISLQFDFLRALYNKSVTGGCPSEPLGPTADMYRERAAELLWAKEYINQLSFQSFQTNTKTFRDLPLYHNINLTVVLSP
jgi:hypothetical protein